MRASRIFTLFTILLTFGAAACLPAPGFTPAPGADFLNTVVAQTVSGAQTQSAVPGVLPSADSVTTSIVPGAPNPTASETPTLFLAGTIRIINPLISVSVATNCRSGPGRVYDYVGALLVGKTAEVMARDPAGNYWLIRNPENGGSLCWIWGQYATLSGDVSVLPIFTPPPTPTPTFTPLPTFTSTPAPTFDVSYSSLEFCGGSWWLDVRVKNTGTIPLKSLNIAIEDRETGTMLADLSDGFTDIDGCMTTTTRDVIAPGETYLFSTPSFSYKPKGNDLRVSLVLCSETGQRGLCAARNFNVSP
jgi:hypothetical protein